MMKKSSCFLYVLMFFALFTTNRSFVVKAEDIKYDYTNVLGYSYSTSQTIFNVYSKNASQISVVVDGESTPLTKIDETNHVWKGYVVGDLNGKEYSFTIKDNKENLYENILDPYGKYINSEGTKNVIYENNANLFEWWVNQVEPLEIKDKNKIIYGINIENYTKHSSWKGEDNNRGKLLGLTESDTGTYLTGYDYIKSLGITYLELSRVNHTISPFSIENQIVSGETPLSGELEFRKVVNSYYLNNIGVVLTFNYKEFSQQFLDNISKLDKESYLNDQGKFDLNKKMSQEYIYELLSYYAENYKLSGIKIENMGDYSISFMNSIISKLKQINKNIMIYGHSTNTIANYVSESSLNEVTHLRVINGSLSYSLLGNLFNNTEKGMLEGNYSPEVLESLKHALLSGVNNGELDYSLVKGINTKKDWLNESSYQLINYIGDRHGLSLFDKLGMNNLLSDSIIEQKTIIAYGVMMMSGGIPYIYSGEEFLASYLDVNKEDDSVCETSGVFCYSTKEENKVIDWSYASKNEKIVNALKALINYRKSNKSIALTDFSVIKNNVEIYTNNEMPGLIGFIRNYPNAYTRDTEKIVALFNFSNNDYVVEMPEEGWRGLYTYNSSSRDGENLIIKAHSLYTEYKEKQPKVSNWFTLFFVIGIIGGIYMLNIFLNKKLVEKRGYDVESVQKKYRPFIKRKEKKDKNVDDSSSETEKEEQNK